MRVIRRFGKAISAVSAAPGPSPENRQMRSRGRPSSALQRDKEVRKQVHVFQHHALAMRILSVQCARPGVATGAVTSEVSPRIVAADEPETVAMVDAILMLVFAALMSANCPFGVSAGSTEDSLVV